MDKVYFYCQSCGNQTPKWLGKCPVCNQWNTIVEEIKSPKTKNQAFDIISSTSQPINVQNIKNDSSSQFSTLDSELDTVLGGGIVDGSVILLAGEPGIGKSTLLLQMALLCSHKILYET